MKNNHFFNIVMFAALFFLTACSNVSTETKVSDDTKKETQKPENPVLTVSIFFSTFDGIDEEGNEYKSVTQERESFRLDKKYTFCYETEEFDHLLIVGTADDLSFYVEQSETVNFSIEHFKLEKKMVFTFDDFNFEIGTPYTIKIKQADKIVFEGNIDSQGCM